jgi:hypothetical protein
MDEKEKAARALAYMQMESESKGWEYLRTHLEDKISSAAKKIMKQKAWVVADERMTGELQLIQTRAWAYQNIINHIEKEIENERKRMENANHGDSQ